MNERDKKLFEERYRGPLIYMCLHIPALVMSFYSVMLVIHVHVILTMEGKTSAEWTTIYEWTIFLVTIFVDILACIYWKKLKSRGMDESRVMPYRILLNFEDKEMLLNCIERYIGLKEMEKNVLYGYQCGNRNIRMFIISMAEYSKEEYKKIKTKSVRKAIKHFGMKTEFATYEIPKSTRINLLLLDKYTEEAYKRTEVNANYGMCYAESLLEVQVDLENKIMLIPAYTGTWYATAAKYYYCVKQLLKWVE